MAADSPQHQAVRSLYNTYPFPPEPLLAEPPPGYNWRWQWSAVHSFCKGTQAPSQRTRILDAGCGTGVGTEYLAHLNPEAEITAIDLSDGALAVARERLERSGVWREGVTLQALNLERAETLPGEFDYINCVGVLHHLPDPKAGIQALAKKLKPGGLFHIFVYAELGRWEIQLVQKAINLLQGKNRGDFRDGVAVGREIFATLPPENRLVRRERERWSLENHRDESFADMYVHPQETDYNIDTLFELIAASGLQFIGFSNPDYWRLERVLGSSPLLMERASALSPLAQYRLIELLDPEITHYEFFLTKPPYQRETWEDDEALRQAGAERHPCLTGWPSRSLFDYNYTPIELTPEEFQFLQLCDAQPGATIAELRRQAPLNLDQIRQLQRRQLLILSPEKKEGF
ncbi:MAG: class I SAM-dependent methyltransferase [Cyanobacteriota bacterium]|nr:class I SAM-dependent methyltransferase [Cyanobacteriota bacterium]